MYSEEAEMLLTLEWSTATEWEAEAPPSAPCMFGVSIQDNEEDVVDSQSINRAPLPTIVFV